MSAPSFSEPARFIPQRRSFLAGRAPLQFRGKLQLNVNIAAQAARWELKTFINIPFLMDKGSQCSAGMPFGFTWAQQ